MHALCVLLHRISLEHAPRPFQTGRGQIYVRTRGRSTPISNRHAPRPFQTGRGHAWADLRADARTRGRTCPGSTAISPVVTDYRAILTKLILSQNVSVMFISLCASCNYILCIVPSFSATSPIRGFQPLSKLVQTLH